MSVPPSHGEGGDTATRLEALEIKAAYAEDMLDQLNLTIYQQQQMLERLMRELVQLREQSSQAQQGTARNLRDDIPPHY